MLGYFSDLFALSKPSIAAQWSNLKTLILNSKILIELKNVQSRACRYSSKHVQNHTYHFLFLYFIWNFPNLQVCVSSVEPRAFLAAVEAGAQMVWSQINSFAFTLFLTQIFDLGHQWLLKEAYVSWNAKWESNCVAMLTRLMVFTGGNWKLWFVLWSRSGFLSREGINQLFIWSWESIFFSYNWFLGLNLTLHGTLSKHCFQFQDFPVLIVINYLHSIVHPVPNICH